MTRPYFEEVRMWMIFIRVGICISSGVWSSALRYPLVQPHAENACPAEEGREPSWRMMAHANNRLASHEQTLGQQG
jgi:hypothetical protein